jgi:hypothetical protein
MNELETNQKLVRISKLLRELDTDDLTDTQLSLYHQTCSLLSSLLDSRSFAKPEA